MNQPNQVGTIGVRPLTEEELEAGLLEMERVNREGTVVECDATPYHPRGFSQRERDRVAKLPDGVPLVPVGPIVKHPDPELMKGPLFTRPVVLLDQLGLGKGDAESRAAYESFRRKSLEEGERARAIENGVWVGVRAAWFLLLGVVAVRGIVWLFGGPR